MIIVCDHQVHESSEEEEDQEGDIEEEHEATESEEEDSGEDLFTSSSVFCSVSFSDGTCNSSQHPTNICNAEALYEMS